MDFIERWFHVSPDGGNGMTEVAIVVAVAMLVVGILCRRQLAKFVTGRVKRARKND